MCCECCTLLCGSVTHSIMKSFAIKFYSKDVSHKTLDHDFSAVSGTLRCVTMLANAALTLHCKFISCIRGASKRYHTSAT